MTTADKSIFSTLILIENPVLDTITLLVTDILWTMIQDILHAMLPGKKLQLMLPICCPDETLQTFSGLVLIKTTTTATATATTS